MVPSSSEVSKVKITPTQASAPLQMSVENLPDRRLFYNRSFCERLSCERSYRNDLPAGIVLFFFALSLIFTITNYFYFSVSFVVLFVPCSLLVASRYLYLSVNAVLWSLLLLYVYFGLSVLMYAPRSFLVHEFYRRDGNFFVTFLPMVLFPMLRFSVSPVKVCERLLCWAALVGVLSYVWHVYDRVNPVFHGLFYAHNAAGGFYAVLCALSLGLYVSTQKKYLICLGGVFFWLLWETDSRGSLLGLVLTLLMINRYLGPLRWYVFYAVLLGLLCTVIFYTLPIWELNGKALSIFEANRAAVSISIPIDRAFTLIDRVFFLWPRAVSLWFQSLFVGVGYGAFNDTPYQIVGVPGILSINQPDHYLYSDFHTHNSYFHVLAEAGLVGLIFLLAFLHHMERFLRTVPVGALSLPLQLALWVAIWTSFTEHRLFTPSQMLPFTLLFALVLSQSSRFNERVGALINNHVLK